MEWIHIQGMQLFQIFGPLLKRDRLLSGAKSFRITKTRLFKYIKNFTTKNWKFSDINSDIFPIFAQNTDCGYSLEPPCRGGSNEYPQSMFLSRNKKKNCISLQIPVLLYKSGV